MKTVMMKNYAEAFGLIQSYSVVEILAASLPCRHCGKAKVKAKTKTNIQVGMFAMISHIPTFLVGAQSFLLILSH